MKRLSVFSTILFVSLMGISSTQADEGLRAQDKDIVNIHALAKSIMEQVEQAETLPEDFVFRFILPADLKKYHVVTGPNGIQGKLLELEKNFAPGSAKFEKFIHLMNKAAMQPVKFNDSRTRAVIEIGSKGLKARFEKFQDQWFVSY